MTRNNTGKEIAAPTFKNKPIPYHSVASGLKEIG